MEWFRLYDTIKRRFRDIKTHEAAISDAFGYIKTKNVKRQKYGTERNQEVIAGLIGR